MSQETTASSSRCWVGNCLANCQQFYQSSLGAISYHPLLSGWASTALSRAFYYGLQHPCPHDFTAVPVAVAKQVLGTIPLTRKRRFTSIREFLKFMLLWELSLQWLCTCSHQFLLLCHGGADLVLIMQSLLLFWYSHPWVSSAAFFRALTISSLCHQSDCGAGHSGYLMLPAFFIMKIGSGNYVEAVTQSTLPLCR